MGSKRVSENKPWLIIQRGQAPLVVSLPHTGTEIPPEFAGGLISPWFARRDADWWIDKLYDFAIELDATIIRTTISRTVIDVNRDPSGLSLYPGQATTELCPTTSFDGEPLYRPGKAPSTTEIAARRTRYFDPYHAALCEELTRLRQKYDQVVLYDCHSIRSRIPRLFDGELPHFNIGTNSGQSADRLLQRQLEAICDASSFKWISNGRFKGGYITRSLGNPERGVQAIQMELACRGYMREPEGLIHEANWPTPYDPARAAPMREILIDILNACIDFASGTRL